MGHGIFLCGLGPGEQGYPTWNPDTHHKGKAPVVRDAVGDGCRYRETGPRSLGLHCVDVGYGMYLCGLGSEHWALQLQTQTFTSPGAAWAKAPVVRDDPVLCFKTMFHIVQGSLKFTI